MKFTKMHGCGNDYIYINRLEEKEPIEDTVSLVRHISDRHFGIGGDGVIFICPCAAADFEMKMYNADGSRGEMCGNGIRCLGKFVYEKGMTSKKRLSVKSGAGVYLLELTVREGQVEQVCVNMGSPVITPGEVITAGGRRYCITRVSMGNPHAVLFTNALEHFPVETAGPCLEYHPHFPQRTNVEFVQVLDRSNIRMRVWERGSKETYACGTGACAAVAACVLNGLTDEQVAVKLLGGELFVTWDRTENLMYLKGPAVTVFEGEF